MDFEASLEAGRQYLVSKQSSDGSWIGEVDLNPGPTAQSVMLFWALRKKFPEHLGSKALAYILRSQTSDGGWVPHFGASSEVSLSIECYVALRLLGMPAADPRLERARKLIRSLGGTDKANTWTQLYLGVLGVRAWEDVAKIPVEMVMIPSWSPIQLKHLSYWVNVISVPMSLLGALGPGPQIPIAQDLTHELEVRKSARNRTQVRTPQSRLRRRAIEKAFQLVEEFREAHGDYGGNSCTAMNVILAFDRHLLNCSDMEASERASLEQKLETALSVLLTYAFEDETEWRLQTCQSLVWDTGFASMALSATAPQSRDLQKAREWIVRRQVRDIAGPWSYNVDAPPGGWCFGNHHDHYPVTDCTAVSLLSLPAEDNKYTDCIALGIRWLLAMQHKSGGWSAYEKYERGQFLHKLIKFKDIPEALVDIPKADVSGKVCEALAFHRRQFPEVEPALQKARSFLLAKREKNSKTRGLWRGNYGVNYIYGTAFAAMALRSIDQQADPEWAEVTRQFFLRTQNGDGGWGETDKSYKDPTLAGIGSPSSTIQSAWAILGLLACQNEDRDISAIENGIRFLQSTQKSDGSWGEDRYLGTVFPEVVYFRYSLYSSYFPVLALAKARASLVMKTP